MEPESFTDCLYDVLRPFFQGLASELCKDFESFVNCLWGFLCVCVCRATTGGSSSPEHTLARGSETVSV